MKFASGFVDEVRDAIPISSVVGRYVTWDKRKTRSAKGDWWSNCCFHSEKSPSFHVDDRKGRYHCFGCGESGDHFSFLMRHSGRSFAEAVEDVASMAGIQMPEPTPEAKAQALKRLTLTEANEAAANWYQRQFEASPEARAYAAARGLAGADLASFRVGYAPEGSGLLRAALGPEADMVDAGLLRREDDGSLKDRFRGRLMFPILDKRGKAMAFTARAMRQGQEPKYLNSPETPIFDKGATLFNYAAARAAAWEGAATVLVEGCIDVVAAARVGLAAVAPLGTSLTAEHAKLLVKMAEDPVFCFDGDEAGRNATSKAIDTVLPLIGPNFTARFAMLPEGQDPDTMVRRNPESFVERVQAARPLADMLWQREAASIGNQPEQRAKLEGALRTALLKIEDRDTRRAYGVDFKDRLASLGKRPQVFRSNSHSQHSTSPGAIRLTAGYSRGSGLNLKEAILIGAIAAAPQVALDMAEELSRDHGLSPEATTLIGGIFGALLRSPDQAVAEVLAAAGLTEAVEEAMGKARAAGVVMLMGSEDAAAASVLTRARRH